MEIVDAIRTENWHRYRIGAGEGVTDYLGRIRAELAQLENLSRIQWTSRVPWRTHTAPSGCWICDLTGVVHGLLALLDDMYPQEQREEEEGLNMLSPRTDVKEQSKDLSPV